MCALGAWWGITGHIANRRSWTSAPQDECTPDVLVGTALLLVSDWDDSIIMTTVSSFLCSIVVGQKYRAEWKVRNPGQPPDDMDYQYWYLRSLFDACSPWGSFHFAIGSRLPTQNGMVFNNLEQQNPRTIGDNWGTYDCYPRPDECARIWRRLVQLAPPAAPSVGHRRNGLRAVTIDSLLKDDDRLETKIVRVGSHNCWTRLLGPGIPAVVVSSRSLYNEGCSPPPQLLLRRRAGACWIMPRGLLALQRAVRVSTRDGAARIGDCWMEYGKTVYLANDREMVVWKIRRANQRDKEAATEWLVWSPLPSEVLTNSYFAPVPWVVGTTG